MVVSRFKGIFWSLLLGMGLFGCSYLDRQSFALPDALSLNQLSENTEGTVIHIRGQVTDNVPFLGQGAYQLQDDTGYVWVVTDQPLPNVGEEIMLKGQLEYESIPISEQDIGEFYVLELEKVTRSPQSAPPTSPKPEISPDPSLTSDPQPSPSPSLDDLFFPHKQNDK
ncbi:MAG: DNA-binding protein [Microcystaceae cyanobacterium]